MSLKKGNCAKIEIKKAKNNLFKKSEALYQIKTS